MREKNIKIRQFFIPKDIHSTFCRNLLFKLLLNYFKFRLESVSSALAQCNKCWCQRLLLVYFMQNLVRGAVVQTIAFPLASSASLIILERLHEENLAHQSPNCRKFHPVTQICFCSLMWHTLPPTFLLPPISLCLSVNLLTSIFAQPFCCFCTLQPCTVVIHLYRL